MLFPLLIRRTFVLPLLISTVFSVSQPYAMLGLLFSPLQVVLYWDAPDNDEDTFITKGQPDSPHSISIKEESKRDGDQRFKLKLKSIILATVAPFIGGFASEAFALFWSPYSIAPYPEIHLFTFHPPNSTVLNRI